MLMNYVFKLRVQNILVNYTLLRCCSSTVSENAIADLEQRGLIHSVCFNERLPPVRGDTGKIVNTRWTRDSCGKSDGISVLKGSLSGSPCLYFGIDPTAPGLHLGHLLGLSAALHCASHGVTSLLMVGGATAFIGDPSGKRSDRMDSGRRTVEENAERMTHLLQTVVANFSRLKPSAADNLRVLNNSTWLHSLGALSYLEEVASLFRMNNMLDRTVVETRISEKKGIPVNEFVYLTLQAYDWSYLFDTFGCTVQVGGEDQLGNMENGYEYIWRKGKVVDPSLCAMAVPLLLAQDGSKLGKSEGNALWVDKITETHQPLKDFLSTLPISTLQTLALMTTGPVEDIKQLAEKIQKDNLISVILDYIHSLMSPV